MESVRDSTSSFANFHSSGRRFGGPVAPKACLCSRLERVRAGEIDQPLQQPRTQSDLARSADGSSTDSELRRLRGILDVAFEVDPEPVKEAYLRTSFQSNRAAYRLWEERQREVGSLPAQETAGSSVPSVDTPSSVDRCVILLQLGLGWVHAGGKSDGGIGRRTSSEARRGASSQYGQGAGVEPGRRGRSGNGTSGVHQHNGHVRGARRAWRKGVARRLLGLHVRRRILWTVGEQGTL